MSRLFPPLDTLSRMHSDAVIQELASNLSAVIATHGAYRPESLHTPSQPVTNPACRKTHKMQTEAKTSQTGPHSSLQDSDPLSTTPITHPVSSGGSAAESHPKRERRTFGTDDPHPIQKALSDWLLEACDPDVPTRAVALRGLTQMVQNRRPEVVQDQEKILTVGCWFPQQCCSWL